MSGITDGMPTTVDTHIQNPAPRIHVEWDQGSQYYHVDHIVRAERLRKAYGKSKPALWKYLVRWSGYDPEYDTWEHSSEFERYAPDDLLAMCYQAQEEWLAELAQGKATDVTTEESETEEMESRAPRIIYDSGSDDSGDELPRQDSQGRKLRPQRRRHYVNAIYATTEYVASWL